MQILFQLAGSDVKSGNVTSLDIEGEPEAESIPSFSLDSESESVAFGVKDEEFLPFLSTKRQTGTVDFKLDTFAALKDTALTDAENATEPTSLRSLPVQDQTNTRIEPVSLNCFEHEVGTIR